MLFSGTIIFAEKIARCFDQIRRVTSTINMLSTAARRLTKKNISYLEHLCTQSSSYKQNCTRAHSTSHTSLITTSDILKTAYVVKLFDSVCDFLFIQGYKMDDLLTSYISLMLTTMNKQRKPATLRAVKKWCYHGNQHEAAAHERRLFHPHYKLQNQQLRDTAHFVTFPTLSIGMTHGTNYSSGNYRLFLFNQVWSGTSLFIWMKFSFPNESSNTPTPSTSLYLLPNKATCYRSEMELIGVLYVTSDW